MKRIFFSRKAILRAIRAACVALFLLAAQREAHAQTYSAPFTNVSGTTYDTQPGIYTTGGFSGTTASYTVTIDSGTTLNTTSSSYGSGVQFYNAKTKIAVGGATFTNNGTVDETLTNPGNGYYSAVALYGTASGGATAVNTGTLSLSATGAIAAGLSFDNSNFGANTPAVSAQPFTLTNSGTISGTASGYGFGVHAKSVGTGNLTITNEQGGNIQGTSSANYAAGVWAHFTGSGSLSVDNAGTISAAGHTRTTGIDALTTTGGIAITNEATGQLTLGNSPSTQQDYGINARSTSGVIDITNAGLISLTANAPTAMAIQGLTSSSSDLQVTNTGTITVSSNASTESGVNIQNQGTGNAVITNFSGGVVDVTTSGVGCTSLGAFAATGTAIVTNNGAVQVGSTGTGSAYGLVATGASGQVTNTGTVGASATSGSSYGIYSYATAAITIANTNAIQATSTGGTASAIYLYTPTGMGTVTNSGALTATGSTDAYGICANGLAGNTPSYTITNSATIQVSCTGSSGYLNSDGIFGDSGQSLQINNNGAITASGTGSHTYVNAISGSGGNISISNTGVLSAISSGGGSYGIYATAQTGVTISNNQTITTTSASGYAEGISAFTLNGAVGVTNSGSLTSNGGIATYGIKAQSSTASVQVGNTGVIHATSTGSTATDIDVTSVTNASVTNSSYLQGSAVSNASGIAINTTGGTASLSNSGNVVLSASGGISGLTTATGTHNSNITNSGNLQLTGGAGTGAAILANNTGTSTAAMTNTGNLSVTTNSNVYGITGVNNAQNASYSITNSGAINLVTNNASSGLIRAQGLTAYAGGSQSVINHGDITISGTSSNVYAGGILCSGGTATVTNSGALNTTASSYANGILADSGNAAATVENSGAMTVIGTGSGAYATGIFILGGGQISNSGNLVVSANAGATGIGVRSFGADATITNSASVSAVSPAGSASGLYINAVTGDANVNNSGHATGTSGSATYVGAGISTLAAAGPTTITNSGYAGGFNTAGGKGYGISVDPAGPIIVTNTGTAIGTTAGIFLTNAGTVNNYGLASGGTYSIQVPTGSTVNLDDSSPILGLLKGGANDTSTSQLNFNLAIRGNHLATDEAALNAAIAQYDAAYTAANGNGANVDSEVVILNGIAYQWEDFLGIADNLVQGRFYGATPGYQGIGSAVDNFDPNSARGTAILAALDNLPESAVANALAQLSPKALQVFRNIAFDGASFTAANVNNHLANQRDGLTGFDTSGFSVNTPGVDPMLTQMRSHLLAFNPAPSDQGLLSDSTSALFGAFDPKDTKATVNTQPVDPWSAFISGSVILANLDNTTSNIGDSDYTTGSILAGVDYRLTNHFTVGALFNYAHTSATLDGNGSKATVDSYSPGIYASYVDKGWYGNAMLMYGFNNNTDDRQVTIPGIAGDNHGASDGGQVTSNFTGGYEFQRGPFKFGPMASLQYVHLTVGSFQEQGPTSLSIDRQDADSLRCQLGVEARYSAQSQTPLGLMIFTPHFQASWQHEYMDNSDGINSQFNGGADGGSFVVQGQQPERDSAFLDLGLDAEVARNVTLFVDYQTQAGQDNFFAQSAQGGVRIGF